ncbi:peptidoglycan-binding protein [Neorhizobium galegae]|uniref:peptidoglycan-binding protein n=1 Tax=Neorhizobium galegae TaxID=399 RepID=UPI002104522F|nr:peptidoglycan-binding protein [Neorhizobium galegae]MCQ1767006.1 peptidoglycan-binding protein [Neorhizobium galegae]MCQ1849027.1 peptidoglycan-binding protein [Neorhizobium galegae]
MNGSRPTPSRPGDRSSLDALNRTIEGLEARIEGLMSGTARDARVSKPADPRLERRPAQPATYREPQFASDPLAEIRERQRMLDASRDRGARPERPRAPELRREEPRHPEPRRTELRPPEAYRPPVRQAPVRAEATRYTETRPVAPAPRREEPRRAAPPRMPAPQPQQPADNGMRDIAQALVSLRQELKQDISESVGREMTALRSEIRSIRSIAEDQHFTEDLRSDLARLAEGISQLGYQATPEAAGLRSEFEELRAVMDGLAREDSVRRMETRWQGLEDRMHGLDPTALREELVSLAYRIDDIKGQLGAMSDSPVIRALEQKLITVASAMEQLGSRMQPNDVLIAEQFATLDERLDEISRAIAAGSRASASASIDQSFLQRLDGRIGALADQIDAISRATHTKFDPTEALSARIEALTGRIEELTDEQAAMRLEERLEQLSLILEQAQKPSQDPDLSAYLADISRKIDGLEQGSVSEVLAERLDHLARRIEEIGYQPQAQSAIDENAFGRIEERLTDIAARLDEATASPRGEDGALRSLEDQIAHLSVLISQPQPGAGAPPAEFENRMTALESYMATNDEYIIEAARQAAETVVEAYSRNGMAGAPGGAADMAALSALADDLRHLEDLTRHSDDRTHQTFEALHGTLVQIADRLDGMEERLVASASAERDRHHDEPSRYEARPAPAMPAAAQLSVAAAEELMRHELAEAEADEQPAATFGHRARAPEETSLDETVLRADHADTKTAIKDNPTRDKATKTSLLTELSRRFLPGGKAEAPKGGRTVIEPTPPLDPSDVLPADRENDLLEPGSGAPDVKKILERVRASQVAGEFDTDRTSAAERADYIAAARRAAKAAAQETDPSQGGSPSKDLRKAAKASANKGFGAMLSQHRRPILMAVGAVLLVLMAMPLAKTLTSGTKAPAAPAPAIEAPARPAAPANMSGSNGIPAVEDQAATDGAESDADIAAAPTPPVEQAPAMANHLTDPRPATGQPSVMEPAGNPLPAQNTFAAVPKADALAAIVVPVGIEPKSLADAAAAGDPNALFEIGARFTDGKGVKSDLSEAANWYKLAADRGVAPAQYRLANLFEKGTGVSRDLTKAMTYYKQAADAGNASAMHNLAVLQASGAAGQPDYAAAVSWFAKAADFGVADSQFNLAILLARGNGVKQDLEESYKWFAVAAKGGDKDAAQKRDEVANAMRKEQLESARAKADQWKVKPLDPKANSVNLPDEWASGKPLTTASVDMEKAIRNIQAILNKSGFDAGTADGKMGAKTVTAIKAFQTSVGQEPNGKITDALVKELLAKNK